MTLSASSYDVLRKRLASGAESLRERLDRLDADRREVFGNVETSLRATAHINTEHRCVPRDVTTVGGRMLLGFNVRFGLKSSVGPSDVLAAYRLDGDAFVPEELGVFGGGRFAEDFAELFKFYKDTRFDRFFVDGPHLHLVFRVGKTPRDIKSFRFDVDGDDVRYAGNRFEHEVVDPPQHEFRWTRVTRDMHRDGAHPHVSIEDRVFVETVGGDLTIKVEDNTADGRGIYREPVDDPDQTLDDAEIHYAVLGNLVLLRMLPYREDSPRHFVFNSKARSVARVDEIAEACVLLPAEQGVIFPGGYALQTGVVQRFDHGQTGMRFLRSVSAPGGEDTLYLFHRVDDGMYVQLRYNRIAGRVDVPLIVHGQTIFDDGTMVCFTEHDEPATHHAVQVWTTPFSREVAAAQGQSDSRLFKIGNRDLVAAMADCRELLTLLDKDDDYEGLYVDVAKAASDIVNAYFWIGEEAAADLKEPLESIRSAAGAAIDEFERVTRVRRETADRFAEVQSEIETLTGELNRSRFDSFDAFTGALHDLRLVRGKAIALGELPHGDADAIAAMEATAAEWTDRISSRAVEFLLQPGALDPAREAIDQAGTRVEAAGTVREAKEVETSVDEAAERLELLTETVSNLRIDDAVKRASLVDALSDVLASLNRVRSKLKAKIGELTRVEGEAEFESQLKLLRQTIAGYLDVCETPEACDEYLTKVLVQVEELEGRFSEFEPFLVRLADVRGEAYEAFETRKTSLVEQRSRRAEALVAAAQRILGGIERRATSMDDPAEIAAYFAGDLMVAKVRDLVKQLEAAEDPVRAADLRGRVKAIQEAALRQQKDRRELYEDGGDVIRLGRHRFAVNRQPLELTTVVRDDALCLHLTGTGLFRPLDDPALEASRDLWDRTVAIESDEVYRAEFAADRWSSLREDSAGSSLSERGATMVKGVHDVDADRIGKALTTLRDGMGRLSFAPRVRAAAMWWAEVYGDRDDVAFFRQWASRRGRLVEAFPDVDVRRWRDRLLQRLEVDGDVLRTLFDSPDLSRVADYLIETWSDDSPAWTVWSVASEIVEKADSLPEPIGNAVADFVTAHVWATGAGADVDPRAALEVAALAVGRPDSIEVVEAEMSATVEVVGDHPRITDGEIVVDYHDLMARVEHHRDHVLPRFDAMRAAKQAAIERSRAVWRIDQLKPDVLSSFVRNRLIDEVHLPLVGDNFAKQLGTAGDDQRTDRMGLLLLISPPGYGKTTLMEYIAQRLGLAMVKINGPALGHHVTSLDPAAAPDAASRRELERLNFAFEIGDNVMLYVDDIQHCDPEFLQKFISLCDGTRRVEGVVDGTPRQFDFRGRRFAVVMAGNPYTESGEKFRIPDMLANRADIYNLGDVVAGHADAFAGSYLENALTSHPALSALAAAPVSDARNVIAAAERGSPEGIEMSVNLSPEAVAEAYQLMTRMVKVRDIVLSVNRAYIDSAATDSAARTEPAFRLQGSYRNMNRMTEKLSPLMTDEEVMAAVVDAYVREAQTLTDGAEANVLKFRELIGRMDDDQRQRWEAIKYAYVESSRTAGLSDDDAAGHLLRQLSAVRDGLESIRREIQTASASVAGGPDPQLIVQHKVPKVLSELIRGQFHLMQEWLRPLLDETVDNGRDLDRLIEELRKLIAGYEAAQDAMGGDRQVRGDGVDARS